MPIWAYMKGRPKKKRVVRKLPKADYFKPRGVPLSSLKVVNPTIDEIEAIRLRDLLDLDLEECAKKMDISRRTLSRILKSGRRKVADALFNGKAINLGGGNFVFRGKMGGIGAGPGGKCICPNCGYTILHKAQNPCSKMICPKCGAKMTREMKEVKK